MEKIDFLQIVGSFFFQLQHNHHPLVKGFVKYQVCPLNPYISELSICQFSMVLSCLTGRDAQFKITEN